MNDNIKELPFEAFDWRNTLFDIIQEYYTNAAIKVLSKYQNEDLEWKDDEGIINYAFEKNIFKQINEALEADIQEDLQSNYE